MKTLYIDVYFLINFTVDLISLYFAALFSKTPSTSKRLIVSALLGAGIAILTVLLPEIPLLKFIVGTLGLFLMGFVAPKPMRTRRKMKFLLSFIIFEALVGGIVSLLWGFLDSIAVRWLLENMSGVANRKMLYFSLIILLSIGVFKMIVSFFSNIESEGSVELEINLLGKKRIIEAFVDSGNLAIDPMDMSPVILLKRDFAASFIPGEIIELTDPDRIDKTARRRIRLVPITRGGATHVLTGLKPDSVYIVRNGEREEISVTVAIDKEGGSFGGYSALMPSAALQNVYSK